MIFQASRFTHVMTDLYFRSEQAFVGFQRNDLKHIVGQDHDKMISFRRIWFIIISTVANEQYSCKDVENYVRSNYFWLFSPRSSVGEKSQSWIWLLKYFSLYREWWW